MRREHNAARRLSDVAAEALYVPALHNEQLEALEPLYFPAEQDEQSSQLSQLVSQLSS